MDNKSIRDSVSFLDIIIDSLAKEGNSHVANLRKIRDDININIIDIAYAVRTKNYDAHPSLIESIDKSLGKRIVRDADNPKKTFVVNVVSMDK